MQRISIARIVNGLIYAWDSLSAAGRRDRGEWRKASVSRQRKEERPRESGCLLNIIFSARGNFHFFVRRLALPPPPPPSFQEDRCEIRREEGSRNPTRFRERWSVADATRRFSRPVVCQTHDATSHSALPFPSLVPSFYP